MLENNKRLIWKAKALGGQHMLHEVSPSNHRVKTTSRHYSWQWWWVYIIHCISHTQTVPMFDNWSTGVSLCILLWSIKLVMSYMTHTHSSITPCWYYCRPTHSQDITASSMEIIVYADLLYLHRLNVLARDCMYRTMKKSYTWPICGALYGIAYSHSRETPAVHRFHQWTAAHLDTQSIRSYILTHHHCHYNSWCSLSLWFDGETSSMCCPPSASLLSK